MLWDHGTGGAGDHTTAARRIPALLLVANTTKVRWTTSGVYGRQISAVRDFSLNLPVSRREDLETLGVSALKFALGICQLNESCKFYLENGAELVKLESNGVDCRPFARD